MRGMGGGGGGGGGGGCGCGGGSSNGSEGSGSGGSGGRQWRTAHSPIVQHPLEDLNAHDGEDEEDEPAEGAHVRDAGQRGYDGMYEGRHAR